MGDPLSSFEVKNIIQMDFMGFDVSITNSSIFMMLTVIVICVLLWMGTVNNGLVPTKMQVLTEKLFFFTGNMIKTNCGKRGIELFPYILSLFLFIMIGNIIGLFPFAFSFTSQLIVTIGIATAIFFVSIIIGLIVQGKHYFSHFCPGDVPSYLVPFFVGVELMSFLFRPMSLGIRLFANMVAGHIMIKVIAGFAVSMAGVTAVSFFSVIPVAVNVLLNVFKLVVCILQAYVFVVLSCMYLSESMESPAHQH